ncbi:MAG: hypothetical protein AAFX39_14840 [Pseudomonadota bacterium]
MDVKKGTKIDPSEVKNLDRSKMAVLIQKPAEPEVEGQALYQDAVQCPWCGAIGWAWIDTDTWLWVTCGNCGYAFQV